jgi:hypothetical protein
MERIEAFRPLILCWRLFVCSGDDDVVKVVGWHGTPLPAVAVGQEGCRGY